MIFDKTFIQIWGMSFHQVVEVILCWDLTIGTEMAPIMKEYCSFYPKYLYKKKKKERNMRLLSS